MINKVKIQNFQSHANSELEFHPGVNVIIGASDSGKSAIIRSLNWVVRNRPSGDSIKSWWGGDTSVEITTNEGIVKRIKGKEGDSCIVTKEGKEIVLKAFGTSVPAEVSALLNIDDVNLQKQLDSPFLLSETPGAVAKHFNKVANLDKIDLAQQNIQKEIRATTSLISLRKKDLEEKQEELSKYANLEEIEQELEKIEAMQVKIKTLNSKIESIGSIINGIAEVDLQLSDILPVLELEEKVKEIFSIVEQEKELELEIKQAETLIKECKRIDKKLQGFEFIVQPEAQVNKILQIIEKEKQVSDKITNVRDLLSVLQYNTNNIKKSTQKLNALEETFHKEMPDVCPLCGK